MKPIWRRRVPFVAQLEMAECGVACLAMLLRFYGARVSLAALRVSCGVSRDGCSALSLVQAAREFGFETKARKVEPSALRHLPLPLIAHWQLNHFVVIERSDERGVTVLDPARGRQRVTPAQLDAAFSGVVLQMRPGPQFRRSRMPAHDRSAGPGYRQLLRTCRPALLQVIGLAMLLEVLELALPAANRVLIDHVIRAGHSLWLFALTSVVVTASALTLLVRALRDRALLLISHALDLSLTADFVTKLIHLPLTFMELRTTGDLMQRVEANTIVRDLSLSIVQGGFDALLVVAFSAMALGYDHLLGGLMIAANLLRVALAGVLSSRSTQLSATAAALAGAERAATVEGLGSPELVRAFHAEAWALRRFSEAQIRRSNAGLELKRMQAGIAQLMSGFDVLVTCALFWLGARMLIDNRLTLGVFVAFMTLRALLFSSVQSFVASCTSFIYARGVMSRLEDVRAAQSPRSGTRNPGNLSGALSLRQVSFKHAGASAPLIDRLDLEIRAGEKLAIVGRTGCGKTTLSRLMLGLLAPDTGSVCVDGVDLRELDRASLMAQMRAVLQEPFFFDRTLRENLTLGAPPVSEERLQRALHLACIDGAVAELPLGLETRMGAKGGRFSRGQLQRFSLARALISEPRILILDEATSALDLPTEAALHQNLSQLDCTRIVVAHRMQTVRDADRILVIENGAISAAGRYDDLVARPGLLHEMVSHAG